MTGTIADNTTALLKRGAGWYLHSGIQEQNGGVARYYRSDLHKNALISTEITGYTASFMLFLYRETEAAEYLDCGLRAANFLTGAAWDSGLGVFPYEYSASSAIVDRLAYFFDSGIIIRGLLRAWRATRHTRFLDTAVAAGRGMIQHFHGPGFHGSGPIHPILLLPSLQPRPSEPRWSANPGCYQLKSAMAWFELFEISGDRQMLSAYEAALDHALAAEDDFLACETDRAKIMDRLHAYLYFLEGMLPRAQQPVCADVLAKGIARTARYLGEIAPSFARSDVYAQLLRIRLFAHALGVVTLDRSAAAKEAEAAAAFQLHSADPRVDGGFGFGTRSGEILPFVNPVSTAFCVQALTLWEKFQHGEINADYHSLI